MDPLIIGVKYTMTHARKGVCVVEVLGFDEVFVKVRIVDPLASTIQLQAEAVTSVTRSAWVFAFA